jgi:hypothetical protein
VAPPPLTYLAVHWSCTLRNHDYSFASRRNKQDSEIIVLKCPLGLILNNFYKKSWNPEQAFKKPNPCRWWWWWSGFYCALYLSMSSFCCLFLNSSLIPLYILLSVKPKINWRLTHCREVPTVNGETSPWNVCALVTTQTVPPSLTCFWTVARLSPQHMTVAEPWYCR